MLDITAISKTFHPGTSNARQALRQLSLHLEDGEFATIVGSNGAGKSTLFGAIAGSFYTDEGRILLDGTEKVAQLLENEGFDVGVYHAGMSNEQREMTQDDFINIG